MSSEQIDHGRIVAWAQQWLGSPIAVDELTGGLTSTMLRLTSDEGSAVARLMTREPWRSHGAALTTREHLVQQMLANTPVPAPRTLALDAEGYVGGVPAHLMTLLPGGIEPHRDDLGSLDALAEALAMIHAIRPTIPVREYQSWAWEAKFVVPEWAQRPRLWSRAFEMLREDWRGSAWSFLHRDFQPRNVLWSQGRIVGIVDWVEASIGPRWLDVAHCCTHLALEHGVRVADEFAARYSALAGVVPEPYFDVMDIVGNLPAPGRASLLTDQGQWQALEDRLAHVIP